MNGLRVQVDGVAQAVETLRQFPRRIRNKRMRIAMNAGAGVIKPAAKAYAPKGDSGLLRRSLTIKVKQNRRGEWFAAIGPKRGLKKVKTKSGIIKTVRKASRREKQSKTYDPARTAHLVEGGTKRHAVSVQNRRALATIVNGVWQSYGKRSYVRARPNPFMAKAAATAGAGAAQKTVAKIKEGVLLEAASLART